MKGKRGFGLLLIILGLACFAGYVLMPKDETNDNKKEEKLTPATRQAEDIVREDSTKLIKYLNSEVEGEEPKCILHLGSEGYGTEEFFNGKDMIPAISVEMYECLFNDKLEIVNSNPFGGASVLTKEQYNSYQQYFNHPLKTVEEVLGTEVDALTGFDPKPYVEKGYYYGYDAGDGFGTSGIKYSLDTINKKDDYYEVNINATYTIFDEDSNKEVPTNYKGVLKVQVVGEHLKYLEMIFNKV